MLENVKARPGGRTRAGNRQTSNQPADTVPPPADMERERGIVTDTVTISRAEYVALYADAMAWRELWQSEHVRDLIEEYREWRRRRDLSESTAVMSALVDWRAVAGAPTYRELERRRNTYDRPALTPEQIRQRAAVSWAAFEAEHAQRGAA